ncbi:MAG: GTP cyclohydrolase, FolE2/MptA family [Candidatus Bathyarchaeota archaeon]|nr:GTP cyclohydrolase, FolE2/MptA family [Candidatus Bathyarchaeota archaeon]
MVQDVQNQKPENEIELEKVGVEGLKKLVTVERPEKTYHVIVSINSYITLPSNLRGVHMSRFVESVEDIPSSTSAIEDLAQQIAVEAFKKHGFHCKTKIFGELPFDRIRPSGKKENSIAKMFATFSTKTKKKMAGISVNGALACPCSKEMCNGLTHNQRGNLSVEIDISNNNVELLDVIEICNQSFSAPTFSLLKRPEEKQVVEQMHENARFVEDVTRKCVQLLKEKYPTKYCAVKCVSMESIHDHNVCSEWRGIL